MTSSPQPLEASSLTVVAINAIDFTTGGEENARDRWIRIDRLWMRFQEGGGDEESS